MTRQPEKILARRGLFLLAARIFPALALLVVMIWYSRVLPATAYGEYQNLWVRYGLLSTLACVGIPALAQVVGPAEMISGLRQSSRAMQGLFAGFFALAALLFGFWNLDFLSFPLLIAFFITWALAALGEGLALGQRHYRLVSFVNGGASLLFLAAHGLFPHNPTALFGTLAVLAGLRAFLFFRPILRAGRQRAPVGLISPPTGLQRLWRDLAAYDLIQQSARLLDKTLVGFLVAPALSAVYFNGAQEVPFLPLLLGVAGSAFLHQAADAQTSEAAEKARYLRATGRLLSAIVFPLFWFLMLGKSSLFQVVFGGKYNASVPVFTMTILVLPLRAYPFSALLQHLRHSRWVLWGAAGDLLLASGLAGILYPLLGLPGIALSFALSTFCMVTFYTWKTVQLTGLSLNELFPIRTWALQLSISAAVLGGIRIVLAFFPVAPWMLLLSLAAAAAGLTVVFGFRNFRKSAP